MAFPIRTLHHAGMTVLVCPDAASASQLAAERLIRLLESARAKQQKAVLGFATGSTPEAVYAHLVARHRDHGLSFRDVYTYNLDEYYPISPLDPRSYRAYMHRHLFSHVDIAPHRAHVLDGTVPQAFAAAHAAQFEKWIEADRGIDLQLLGIGRNGHIGFNEPCDLAVEEALQLRTRLVELHPITREGAAREFGGLERVIPHALTMGIATILDARAILMLGTGESKAPAITRALSGPMTAQLPASLLQSVAGKVVWILDEAAASGLR
jgi:glucosamine-6-phosphate deaminase